MTSCMNMNKDMNKRTAAQQQGRQQHPLAQAAALALTKPPAAVRMGKAAAMAAAAITRNQAVR